MLCTFDGSAQWICKMDPSLARASIDCASIDQSRCTIDGWSCTTDLPCPSIVVYTVSHLDDRTKAE